MNGHAPGCTSSFGSLFCFLAGGLAGAGVALLLAPQSGRATRELTRRKLRDTAGSARGFKDRLIRRSREVRDEAGHRMDGAASALAGDRDPKRAG